MKKNSILSLFLSAVFLAIVIIAGGMFYYKNEAESIKKIKYSELSAITRLKVNHILQWRRERLSEAVFFSTNNDFIKNTISFLSGRNLNSLRQYFTNTLSIIRKNHGYNNIYIVSSKKQIVFSLDARVKEIDDVIVKDIDSAVQNRKIVFTDFKLSSQDKSIQINIIAPILDKNIPKAVLIFKIDPWKSLYPFIQSEPTPTRTMETLIVRREEDSVLFLNELRFRKNAALRFKLPLSEKNIPAVQAVLGRKGVYEGADYTGEKALSDISPIPGTPWFMIVKISQNEIYSELFFRAIAISIIVFVLIISLIAGVFWLYHYRQKNIYKELLEKEKELSESREEFRITLYSIGDAVITTNINGNVKRMNTVAEQLTGWNEADAKCKSLFEICTLINEKSRERIDDPVTVVLKNGVATGLENDALLISKLGKEIPIADSGAPIKNESGEITGIVFVFRDQTKERAAQKMLTDSEEKFRAIFENNSSAIAIIDLDTTISMVNDSYCKISGYTKEEVIGMSWTQHLPPEELERVKEYNRRRLIDPRNAPDKYELKVYRKNGDLRDGIISVSMIQSIQKIIISLIDITERKQAEEALRASEEKYRAIVENANDQIFVVNREMKYLSVNKAVSNNLGKSEKELIGKSLYEVFPSDSADRFSRNIQEVIQTGKNMALEEKAEVGDSILWINTQLNSIRDNEGNVSAVMGVVRDITKRKQAEDALKRSEELYRLITDNTSDLISLADMNGNFLYASSSHKTVLGYSPEELKSTPVFSLIHPEQLQNIIKVYSEAVQLKRKITSFPLKFKHKNGNWIDLETTANIIFDPAGNPVQIVTVTKDISERKQAELKLQKYAAELKNANETKDKFFSIISHDLKSPFQGLLGYSEILASEYNTLPEEERLFFINCINELVHSAYQLLENLLEWSRLQTGKVPYIPGVYNLYDLILPTISMLAQTAKEKAITFEYNIDKTIMVEADKNMLSSIVRNLVSNAIKFTCSGGSIILSEISSDGFVEISVTDTGVGMQKEILENLFNLGGNISSKGTKNEEGTGLGLILCKDMVEKHGGRIWVESEVGKGSKFIFTIPMKA